MSSMVSRYDALPRLPLWQRKLWIRAAAQRIYKRILDAHQGRLPTCITDWIMLAQKLGADVGSIRNRPGFTGRVTYSPELGKWVIMYNGDVSNKLACRYIAHEIAEYLAIADFPTLFDMLPKQVFCYTGGNSPTDGRHLIACEVERLCFKKRI